MSDLPSFYLKCLIITSQHFTEVSKTLVSGALVEQRNVLSLNVLKLLFMCVKQKLKSTQKHTISVVMCDTYKVVPSTRGSITFNLVKLPGNYHHCP